MERLALFISGGGTTATAIINACKPEGELDDFIKPVLVISSRNDAKGIGRVIETKMLAPNDIIVRRPRDFNDEVLFGLALIMECVNRGVTLFGQYGWAVKTPGNFIKSFPRGINQHPCPLSPGNPDFGGHKMLGKTCHLARLLFVRMTNRAFWTRAVAHRVYPKYDEGPILRQAQMEILPGDDPITLAERLLPFEHRVQIETLKDFAKAQVKEVPGEELVRPHEIPLWKIACEVAKLAFPKG